MTQKTPVGVGSSRHFVYSHLRASQVAPGAKNPPANAGYAGDTGSIPRLGKIPWRRKWQLTLVFLPGKSHGQRGLVSYSPWSYKESDTTERLSSPLTSQVQGWEKGLLSSVFEHEQRFCAFSWAAQWAGFVLMQMGLRMNFFGTKVEKRMVSISSLSL